MWSLHVLSETSECLIRKWWLNVSSIEANSCSVCPLCHVRAVSSSILCLCISFTPLFFLPNFSNPHAPTQGHANPVETGPRHSALPNPPMLAANLDFSVPEQVCRPSENIYWVSPRCQAWSWAWDGIWTGKFIFLYREG